MLGSYIKFQNIIFDDVIRLEFAKGEIGKLWKDHMENKELLKSDDL